MCFVSCLLIYFNKLFVYFNQLFVLQVTPAEDVQTKSTLDFAARAKKIVQHATVNEIMDPKAEIAKYREQMNEYKKEIERIKNEKSNDELVMRFVYFCLHLITFCLLRKRKIPSYWNAWKICNFKNK